MEEILMMLVVLNLNLYPVKLPRRIHLQDKLSEGEKVWCCPGCQSWAVIPAQSSTAKCMEIGCNLSSCVR